MKTITVSRWRLVLLQFTLFSSIFACGQALLRLHRLGQDISYIVIGAFVAGLLFVTLSYFYSKITSVASDSTTT